MHVVHVNGFVDADLDDPDALLKRYHTLTSWCGALRAQGAERVTVVQRFRRDLVVDRGGISYVFAADEARGRSPSRAWVSGLVARLGVLGPDVVHLHGLWFADVAARVKDAFVGLPVLVQHHAEGPPRLPWRRWRLRRHVRRLDGVLFTSVAQSDPWRDAGVLPAAVRVFEVPESGANVRPVPVADARARTGLSGAPAIVWVGRLNDNKDPLTVLAGFRLALQTLAGARLTFVYGAEPALLTDVASQVAGSAALADTVRLRGSVSHTEVLEILSAADIFVLGSHREGSGYALIEAMACGVIPAVTDIPAFRKLTADGEAGVLWRVGDARACADAMVSAARLDRESWRARVRARFEAELSWNAVGRRAMDIYRDVVQRATSRAGAGS